MSAAFLICVERGFLEDQAVLLCESIRTFAGAASGAEIHAFQPRPGHHVHGETRERLHALGVNLHDEIRNTRFPQYPRTSKIYACTWAERELDATTLVFVDSDTVFLQEPTALFDGGDWAVAVRPVDSKNSCSSGPGDPKETYWQRLYAAAGVSPPGYVETTIEGDRVRACWNSGLVAVRREAGLFAQWQQDFEAIMDAGVLPALKPKRGHGIPFLDQNAFAATLARCPDAIRMLPAGYNYCLPKRAEMGPELRSLGWDELVHLHYHGLFVRRGALRRLTPPLPASDARRVWLEERLPLRRHGKRWSWREWRQPHVAA